MSNVGSSELSGERGSGFNSRLVAQIPDLYRFARWLVANEAEAEDVVGETLLRALERADQFRGDANLRTWLHQILHHIAVDRSRHQSHETVVDEVIERWGDESFSVDASLVVERAETRAELEEALVHLPYSHRVVVVLHDAEEWSISEIATLLDLGQPAVKQRLRRGRMMLVSILAQREERRVANSDMTMSCVDARGHVSDYIDGELSPRQRSELEEHLATCVTCPPLYVALVGVKESLGGFRDSNSVIPPDILRRIRDKSTSQR